MDVVREQLKMAFKEQCRVEVQPWDMDGRAEVQPRGVVDMDGEQVNVVFEKQTKDEVIRNVPLVILRCSPGTRSSGM